MKTKQLKIASFKNATLATVLTNAALFLQGSAVLAGASGTIDYAAGLVGESILIDQELIHDGAAYVLTIFFG
jgi:hypothetical protein